MFPIPSNLIVYGVVVLTLFLSGFWVDRHFFYAPYKAEVKAQSLAQQKINEATITQYKQATQKAENDATKRTAAVHSLYKRLYPSTSSKGMPKTTGSQGANEYSSNNLPPTSKLAEDCAITTVTLLTLQEWVEKVSE